MSEDTGIDTIRLGGQRVSELPWTSQAQIRNDLKLAEDTERQNKIDNVLARYPKQSVGYLQSRIDECLENIKRMNQHKSDTGNRLSDYAAQISLCEHRDREIARIPEDALDREAQIKDLKKRFPPYDVVEMQKQVLQFKEDIIRFDRVIETENASIAEHEKYKALCESRDRELKQLGVKLG